MLLQALRCPTAPFCSLCTSISLPSPSAWRLQWEQQWGAECSSMLFELPHFALELLVVLPCVQVISRELAVRVVWWLQGAAGARMFAPVPAFLESLFHTSSVQLNRHPPHCMPASTDLLRSAAGDGAAPHS